MVDDDFDVVAFAIEAAAFWHKGQKDLAGLPYITHPIRVMQNAMDMTEDPQLWAVAVLHDVIEDTDAKMRYITPYLESHAARALEAITHWPNEPYEEYFLRVLEDPHATLVKLADMEDNFDPERLSYLPQGQQERLTKKYAHRLEILRDAVARNEVS